MVTTTYPLTCGLCGMAFASVDPGARFCSRACYHQSRLKPTDQRLWGRTRKGEGCWEWQGPKHDKGYGYLSHKGRITYAHRAAWELTYGPVPRGLCVLHRCDNPPCVRPDHLFLGTKTDNSADMKAKGRAAQGDRHPFRADPTLVARGDRNGSRTHPERLARGERHGLRLHPERVTRGEDHHAAVLTEAMVREIRASTEPTAELANRLAVSRNSVADVRRGRTWRHIA